LQADLNGRLVPGASITPGIDINEKSSRPAGDVARSQTSRDIQADVQNYSGQQCANAGIQTIGESDDWDEDSRQALVSSECGAPHAAVDAQSGFSVIFCGYYKL
jgi:hypothetical protein